LFLLRVALTERKRKKKRERKEDEVQSVRGDDEVVAQHASNEDGARGVFGAASAVGREVLRMPVLSFLFSFLSLFRFCISLLLCSGDDDNNKSLSRLNVRR
jgi:hypothetical protein